MLIVFCLAATSEAAAVSVKSPDGRVELVFSTDASGQLAYRVLYRGKPVIAESQLGLDLEGQKTLGAGLRMLPAERNSADETYQVVAGKSNPVRNRFNALGLRLEETSEPRRRLMLEARAYDDGVAFCYVTPGQEALKEFRLVRERTQFQLARDSVVYPLFLKSFQTSYENEFTKVAAAGVPPNQLIGLPLLVQVPGAAWLAITEADLENYAGMYLVNPGSKAPGLLEARLALQVDAEAALAAPRGQPASELPGGLCVTGTPPVRSPWRVIMVADQPGRLIESNLVINLNPPSAVADTSWIRPGKAAWDWWSGQVVTGADFEGGMNTATMKYYIDFAARAGLEYMLIDAGWSARDDITHAIPAIDMPDILRHAEAKKVKIWLWLNWKDVQRQMDQAFPLYRKWGVVGVKIDYMDRDDQWMVEFYHSALQKAAEHRLMVDFHGAYKPDGMRRTWPNFVTQEGVLGLEYLKWSDRATPDHNVLLPFTRMLAGPMDYTPGGFDNVTRAEFKPRRKAPMTLGTRAHQVALFVVFESPMQVLADHPAAYEGQAGFDFIRVVPTIWDETRVLNGEVGGYVTIARRKGREWYLGSITGSTPRELQVPLGFLGQGRFLAEIYADAPDAAENPKKLTVEKKAVDSSARWQLKLAAGGGCAIRFQPE